VGERVALGGGGGEGGARRRWGRGWRGDREARGGGGQGGAHTGGAEACSGVLLQVGAFNIENAPRCILVPPYTVFIYYTWVHSI
jgi:hypothetical protein